MNCRTIIASYSTFERLLDAFPKRTIEATAYAPNGWFYWFGNKSAVRMMHIDSKTVWVLDHERGFPHIKIRRVLNKR